MSIECVYIVPCHYISCVASGSQCKDQDAEPVRHHKGLPCVTSSELHLRLSSSPSLTWQPLTVFHHCNFVTLRILYKCDHIACKFF